jgi:beta-phosphoglucomutase-like phosphatase (HAD superfamily)
MYKKNYKGKKAVLFDLDGTIIDSEYLWDLAFKNVVKNLDLDVN